MWGRRRAERICGYGVGLGLGLGPAAVFAAPTEPGELQNGLAQASDCNYCHSFSNQENLESEPPYAPQIGWTPTLMANSAVDPVFWAAMALAAQDDASADGPAGHTEDCVRCHAPRAFLSGRGHATRIEDLLPEDEDGVTCELCHRMTADSVIGNAQYSIDDVLSGNTVARRGPWDYSDGVPAPDPASAHATRFDPFTGSSELCGTCHDVTTHNERVDDEGVGMGMDFNEQRTYSEWAASSYAEPGEGFRSCQDCHMPEVPDSAACADYTNLYQHPVGNRRHDLLGANRFMMTLLAEDAPPGFTQATFSLALDALDEFVKTSATLEVEFPTSVALTEGMSGLSATVTNESGHKLPSGYSEGRVMWLEVVARYGDDVVFSSGLWDQAAGTIEDDPQVRRYEGIAEDFETGVRNHLLLNNHWIVDTRIPPRGLQPNVETDPVGNRYALGSDGAWEHWDTHSYTFEPNLQVYDATPADSTDDHLDVSVRLLYLINTPEYIGQLADDNVTTEVGAELAARFDLMGGATPVVLAEAQAEVPVTGFAEGTGSTSSGTSTTTSAPDTQSSSDGSSSADTLDPDGTTRTGGDGSSGTETEGGEEEPSDGCSCSTRSTGAGSWLLGLVLLGFLRPGRRLSSSTR